MLLAWLALAGALAALVPPTNPLAREPVSFLPPDMPSQRALAELDRKFPRAVGLSQAVVVIDRPGGPLTPADMAVLARIAGEIPDPKASPFGPRGQVANVTVTTPTDLPAELARAFISPVAPGKGQAALLMVQIPASFITMRTTYVVDHIQHILHSVKVPPGLKLGLTGSAVYGHDYAEAAKASYHRTLWVTIVAVLVILLVVYRAPLAAAVPLVAVSLAAVVATYVLAALSRVGLQVGAGESIFVYVLLYGAGVDYSLFFIARCREYLRNGATVCRSTQAGWMGTAGAIAASASTTILGLLTLWLSRYRIFAQVGPAVAVGLTISLAAALTLIPALVAIMGRRIFWPGRLTRSMAPRHVWPAIARRVVDHPVITLMLSVTVLAALASQTFRLRWVYDTLTELRSSYPSVRGTAMIRQHWPVGELAPVSVLIETPATTSPAQLRRLAGVATRKLLAEPGVTDVRSAASPIGVRQAQSTRPASHLLGALARSLAAQTYLAPKAARLQVILAEGPYSLRAMHALSRIRGAVQGALSAESLAGSKVYLAGATAEMADIRAVTQRDFHLVAAACLVVITLIVVLLVRDLVLTAVMVASTVLGYLATLGLTWWVFTVLLGEPGLDWKVEVFLFVVMVAVGQDYNIFLASRLGQEGHVAGVKPAARKALASTGGIISSCGLIMAATLGSLMAGDLKLLAQLGFALSAGMLIDTFLVRPMIIPSVAVLTGRTGRGVRVSLHRNSATSRPSG